MVTHGIINVFILFVRIFETSPSISVPHLARRQLITSAKAPTSELINIVICQALHYNLIFTSRNNVETVHFKPARETLDKLWKCMSEKTLEEKLFQTNR